MAIAQLGYNLQFVSGINCDGINESPVIRMVVQYGDEAVCYLKDRSFAQRCADRIGKVTELSFNISKVGEELNKSFCLVASAQFDYKANKKLAEQLNNKHAQQLTSELFGANPDQLLFRFPEPEQAR